MQSTAGVFGAPPTDLARVPPGATQFSPLIVGSSPLEAVPPASLDSFTMLAPPGTTERRYALAQVLKALKIGGSLLALAPKDKGGSRISRELEKFGCTVEGDSKRHHKICAVSRPAQLSGIEE